MKIFWKIADSRAFVTTLAAVALIAAQMIVINHDLADSHTQDSACEFCISGAGLADANVGEITAAVLANVALHIPDAVHDVQSNGTLRYHFARAPPTAS